MPASKDLPGDIRRLLLENRAWAAERDQINPGYFAEMAKDQRPSFLWIGCSDSRVPPNEITGTHPGEMFVARNIANLVVHTDLSLMSVVDYAVSTLGVHHLIVCGHYGCGGVRASMGHAHLGLLNKWVRNIKDVYAANVAELEALPDGDARVDRLVELNAIEQARNLACTSVVQRAWFEGRPVNVHAWVYDMRSGLLRAMAVFDKVADIPEVYRFHF